MNLLKINPANIVNLDAIASISAGQDDSEFVFCIRYLVHGKDGEETPPAPSDHADHFDYPPETGVCFRDAIYC